MTEEETTGQEFNLRDYYYVLMKRKRLVIHGGVTERDTLLAAKERLDAAGVRILGVVTNNLDMTRHGYYNYYPYYRYQGRYKERNEITFGRKAGSDGGDSATLA